MSITSKELQEAMVGNRLALSKLYPLIPTTAQADAVAALTGQIAAGDTELVSPAVQSAAVALTTGTSATGSLIVSGTRTFTGGENLYIPCGTLAAPTAAFLVLQISGSPAATGGYTGVEIGGLDTDGKAAAVKTAIEAVSGHNLTITRTGSRLDLVQNSPGGFGNGVIWHNVDWCTTTGMSGGGSPSTQMSAMGIIPADAYDCMRVGPEGQAITFTSREGNPEWRIFTTHHPTQYVDQVLQFSYNLKPGLRDGAVSAWVQDDAAQGSTSFQFETNWTDGWVADEWLLNYNGPALANFTRALCHLHNKSTDDMFWGFGTRRGYYYALEMDKDGVLVRDRLQIKGPNLAGASPSELLVVDHLTRSLAVWARANVVVGYIGNNDVLMSGGSEGDFGILAAAGLRLSGTTIGFFGAAGYAQQVLAADPTPAAISTVLKNLGLTTYT